MRRATTSAIGVALVCGLIGAAGCGRGDEVARHEAGPLIAPAGKGAATPGRVGNAAPTIVSVRFDPAEPGAGESVRAVVEATDSDGDGLRFGYAWRVDGESVEVAGAKIGLPAKVRRGASLEVRVTASDGHAESEPVVATTVVGNRAPRLSGLTIQPAGKITAAGPIRAVASGSDPDGDAVEYLFTWLINGETSDEKGPVLSTPMLKRGDVVSVSVEASDGQSESEPLESPLIEVVNAAPVIRSQPNTAGAQNAFSYHVIAEDADGDRLRYGLASAPEGMTLLAMSGDIDWTPREDQAGTHAVDIWVEDPQGARATQRFELTIGEPQAAAAKQTTPAAPAEEPLAGDR